MAKLLRHKETGVLFPYHPLFAKNAELELVEDDPVKQVLSEVKSEAGKDDASLSDVLWDDPLLPPRKTAKMKAK